MKPKHTNTKQACQGFTLLELMTVVAILVITTTIVVPGFINMKTRYEVRDAAAKLTQAIRTAKNESQARSRVVGVNYNYNTTTKELKFRVVTPPGAGANPALPDLDLTKISPVTIDNIQSDANATIWFSSNGMVAKPTPTASDPIDITLTSTKNTGMTQLVSINNVFGNVEVN